MSVKSVLIATLFAVPSAAAAQSNAAPVGQLASLMPSVLCLVLENGAPDVQFLLRSGSGMNTVTMIGSETKLAAGSFLDFSTTIGEGFFVRKAERFTYLNSNGVASEGRCIDIGSVFKSREIESLLGEFVGALDNSALKECQGRLYSAEEQVRDAVRQVSDANASSSGRAEELGACERQLTEKSGLVSRMIVELSDAKNSVRRMDQKNIDTATRLGGEIAKLQAEIRELKKRIEVSCDGGLC